MQHSTSQSSDKSQLQYLTPVDSYSSAHLRPNPFLPYDPNARESLSSSFYTDPSSYYSAEDDIISEVFEEDELPVATALPNPHSRDNTLTQVETKEGGTDKWDDFGVVGKDSGPGQPQAKAQTQTQLPTTTTPIKGSNRNSTRTNSTRTTGRSGSLGTSVGHATLGVGAGVNRAGSVTPSVIEPSRQSTSDSGVYRVGQGAAANVVAGGKGQGVTGEGEQPPSLEEMVAGLGELIEQPEVEETEGDERTRGTEKMMKMPEPQHFDEKYFGMQGAGAGDDAHDIGRTRRQMQMPEAVRIPEPPAYAFSNADVVPESEITLVSGWFNTPTSSQTHGGQGQGPLGGQTRTRKVSPLIGKMIPPAPKSRPPVPSEPTLGSISLNRPSGSGGLASGSGVAEKESDRTAPLKVQKQAKGGGVGAKRTAGGTPAQQEGEDEGSKEEQEFGTVVITSTASSRIERLTNGSGSYGRRTTLSSASYTRRPETQSTLTKLENGNLLSGVGRGRQSDEHSKTASVIGPRVRKPSGAVPGSEDAHQDPDALSAGERYPTRPPHLPGTYSQMDTKYGNMFVGLDDILMKHNVAATFFNWILLAGFILLPGTFERSKNTDGRPFNRVLKSATRLPL